MNTNRNVRQCRDRWLNYLSPFVVNGPWTPEEDNLLIQKYNEIGPYWKKIAVFFPSRTDINLKSRWNWHVRQNTKQRLEYQKKILHQISLDGNAQIQRYLGVLARNSSNKQTNSIIENDDHPVIETSDSVCNTNDQENNTTKAQKETAVSFKASPNKEVQTIDLHDDDDVFDYDYKRLGFQVESRSKPTALEATLNKA